MPLTLLPCEHFHREFDAKLLMGIYLTSIFDHTVLIGYDKHFNNLVGHLESPLLLDKSCSSIIWNGRIKLVKESEGCVLINDEEGFNNISDEKRASFLNRVDKVAAKMIDKYICWGRHDRQFFSQIKEFTGKLIELGNCRSDLLGIVGKSFYKNKIKGLNSLFGDYVLCVDNFCIELRNKKYKLPVFNISQEQDKQSKAEYQAIMHNQLIRRDKYAEYLESALREFPHITFVLRPHPISDPKWWLERFWMYRNFQIIYHDSVEPWLHAASCVVTMGCTSAIQSIIASTPVIEIIDNFTGSNPLGLSHRFTSFHADSSAVLCQQLAQIFHSPNNPEYFLELGLLNKLWTNAQETNVHPIFAEFLHEHKPQHAHAHAQYKKLSDVLEAYNKSKLLMNFDTIKWPESSFKQIAEKFLMMAKTINVENVSILKVKPGLYLLKRK